MARTICRVFGVALLLAGVAGFAMPHLMGLHLTPMHNIVHIATGAVALYLGFTGGDRAVRTFCVAFGVFCLALAAVGFTVPGLMAALINHAPVGSAELLPDNVVHLVVGALFLLASLAAPRRIPTERAA